MNPMLLPLIASREALELRVVAVLCDAGCPDTEARDAARALLARAARDASADPQGTFEVYAELALARIGSRSRTGPLPPAALPRTVALTPTPAPEPVSPSIPPSPHRVPGPASSDPWTAFVGDVLALQGADLSRALPLGGVQPGGSSTGDPPAELLSRLTRGDIGRARAALRRLAGCSPTVTQGLSEILTPGMDLPEAAGRYAVLHGPLDLRDALERAMARETVARTALAASRTARGARARRSLADPSREALARLVEVREGALTDAAAGTCAARSRLVSWGLGVLEGELARYQGVEG